MSPILGTDMSTQSLGTSPIPQGEPWQMTVTALHYACTAARYCPARPGTNCHSCVEATMVGVDCGDGPMYAHPCQRIDAGGTQMINHPRAPRVARRVGYVEQWRESHAKAFA